MNEKAKESLNKAGNICLFVKENSGDEQTARYMAEAIAAINEAVAQETAKVEQSGNDAALREAAEKLVRYLPRFVEAIDYYGVDGYYREAYDQDIKELHGRMKFLEAALAMEKG